MADVANAQQDHWPGGAGLDHVAASTTDFRFLIFRMYVSFHKRRQNLSVNGTLTSVNLRPSQADFSPPIRLGLPPRAIRRSSRTFPNPRWPPPPAGRLSPGNRCGRDK